jgi:hypothetical protein
VRADRWPEMLCHNLKEWKYESKRRKNDSRAAVTFRFDLFVIGLTSKKLSSRIGTDLQNWYRYRYWIAKMSTGVQSIDSTENDHKDCFKGTVS